MEEVTGGGGSGGFGGGGRVYRSGWICGSKVEETVEVVVVGSSNTRILLVFRVKTVEDVFCFDSLIIAR